MGTQVADKCDKYRYNDHIAHKNVWFRYSYTCSKKNLAKTYTFEKFRFLPPGGFCVSTIISALESNLILQSYQLGQTRKGLESAVSGQGSPSKEKYNSFNLS